MTNEPESGTPEQAVDTDQDDPGWPISFLLLVGAGALYLALRLIQFVADVVG